MEHLIIYMYHMCSCTLFVVRCPPVDAYLHKHPLETAKSILYNPWAEIPSLSPLEAGLDRAFQHTIKGQQAWTIRVPVNWGLTLKESLA